MTLPTGLIHHWDPSVEPTGPYLKDTVGNVDGILGRRDRGPFNTKIAREVRTIPIGIDYRDSRHFWVDNEFSWTDTGVTQNIESAFMPRSPHMMDYILPNTVPPGIKVACGALSPDFGDQSEGDKWIYVDFWFQWDFLKFPASGIVKLVSLRSGGSDKLWFGLEPQRDALGAIDDR